MKITQLRNATLILEIGVYRILVDPMLAAKAALPPLRLFDGLRLRNPIVELPAVSAAALESVTHCLITHCQKGHFDHLDSVGKRWLREKQIPVICTPHDAHYLSQRGLKVQALAGQHQQPQAFFEGYIQTMRCTHGLGLVGKFMEHGVGYLITLPGEPSIYLCGDSVYTPEIGDFLRLHQPQICVIPAGGASFDIGQDLIMGVADAITFSQAASGIVVANHLEALSHCPVSRAELARAVSAAGLSERFYIPEDGETLEFSL